MREDALFFVVKLDYC